MFAVNQDRRRESGEELVMGQGRFVGPKTSETHMTASESYDPYQPQKPENSEARGED
jgi:hypothetical protein